MNRKPSAERERRRYRREKNGDVFIRGDIPNRLACALVDAGMISDGERNPEAWAKAVCEMCAALLGLSLTV